MSQGFEAFVCVCESRNGTLHTTDNDIKGRAARGYLRGWRSRPWPSSNRAGTRLPTARRSNVSDLLWTTDFELCLRFTGSRFLAAPATLSVEGKGVTVVIEIGLPRFATVSHGISKANSDRDLQASFIRRWFLMRDITLGQGNTLFPGLLAGTDISIGSHVYTHHHVHSATTRCSAILSVSHLAHSSAAARKSRQRRVGVGSDRAPQHSRR